MAKLATLTGKYVFSVMGKRHQGVLLLHVATLIGLWWMPPPMMPWMVLGVVRDIGGRISQSNFSYVNATQARALRCYDAL